MRCALVARLRDCFDLSFNVGLYLKPVIQFGFVAFMTCAADVLDTVTRKIIKVLVNNEIPDLNLSPLVVTRAVLAH